MSPDNPVGKNEELALTTHESPKRTLLTWLRDKTHDLVASSGPLGVAVIGGGILYFAVKPGQANADDFDDCQAVIQQLNENNFDANSVGISDVKYDSEGNPTHLSVPVIDGIYEMEIGGQSSLLTSTAEPRATFGPGDSVFTISGATVSRINEDQSLTQLNFFAENLSPLEGQSALTSGSDGLFIREYDGQDFDARTQVDFSVEGLRYVKLNGRKDTMAVLVEGENGSSDILFYRVSFDEVDGFSVGEQLDERIDSVSEEAIIGFFGRTILFRREFRGQAQYVCERDFLPEREIQDPCDGFVSEACTFENNHGTVDAMTICNEDGETVCHTDTPPQAEVCDGEDNNFDGEVDEGVMNECGTCGEPVLNACGTCGPAPEEVLNGEDDDCDGEIDEGFDPVDLDEDGVRDDVDNCDDRYNPGQVDVNNDGIGDACQKGETSPELGKTVLTEGCLEVRNLEDLDAEGIRYEISENGTVIIYGEPGDSLRFARDCTEEGVNSGEYVNYNVRLPRGVIIERINVLEGTLVIIRDGETINISAEDMPMQMPIELPEGAVLGTIGSVFEIVIAERTMDPPENPYACVDKEGNENPDCTPEEPVHTDTWEEVEINDNGGVVVLSTQRKSDGEQRQPVGMRPADEKDMIEGDKGITEETILDEQATASCSVAGGPSNKENTPWGLLGGLALGAVVVTRKKLGSALESAKDKATYASQWLGL